MTVNLGPIDPSIDPAIPIPKNPRSDGYGYNPRCLRRDVNNYWTSEYIRDDDVAAHIQAHSDILSFETSLQNRTDLENGILKNLHSGGHYSIWGDPGGDVFVSPSDPAFFLHHTQLDRHWWMWQNYLGDEVKKRTWDYQGGTFWLDPDSPPGKITDPQWVNIVAPEGWEGTPSTGLISTTAGPFCYVYV
jgi:tyrosinase